MRHAALHLLFAGLGAEQAVTRAWHDNIASLAVTRSLPYTSAGSSEEKRRDRTDTMLAFSMTRHHWQAIRRTDLELTGIEASSAFLFLGLATTAGRP